MSSDSPLISPIPLDLSRLKNKEEGTDINELNSGSITSPRKNSSKLVLSPSPEKKDKAGFHIHLKQKRYNKYENNHEIMPEFVKKEKKRVKFIDQEKGIRLVQVIEVQSFKQYNIDNSLPPEDSKAKEKCQCACIII